MAVTEAAPAPTQMAMATPIRHGTQVGGRSALHYNEIQELFPRRAAVVEGFPQPVAHAIVESSVFGLDKCRLSARDCLSKVDKELPRVEVHVGLAVAPSAGGPRFGQAWAFLGRGSAGRQEQEDEEDAHHEAGRRREAGHEADRIKRGVAEAHGEGRLTVRRQLRVVHLAWEGEASDMRM
jgi:hypothetical protein